MPHHASAFHPATFGRAGALVLAAAVLLTPCAAAAAAPEPLPPPPELLDAAGYPIDSPGAAPARPAPSSQPHPAYNAYPARPAYAANAPVPQRPAPQPSNTGDAPYDPYNVPASSYLPPLPGQEDLGTAQFLDGPGGQDSFAIPELQPPPMASLPSPQPQSSSSAPFRASPPAPTMPEDYYNLPLDHNNDVIPGVLMPTVNDEFYDPAWVPPARRAIRQGMSERQLEPFFDVAKGSEKAALDARAAGDTAGYGRELQNAVDGYMEIIAMADAANDAREEAWYGVGRCEYRRENWWRAFDAIERSFPHNFQKAEVEGRIRLEMFIGERLWRMGRAPVPDSRKDGTVLTGYQAASRVYAAAIFNQPTSADAPLALLRRGDAAAMEENWEEAAKFYRSVVQHYPESESAMQARSSLAEAVHRQEWPAGLPEAARQDLNTIMTAVEETERKLSVPAEDRRRRAAVLANTHDADIMLRQAKDYLSKIKLEKSRDAGVFLLGNIVSNYPATPQAREAAAMLRDLGIDPPMVLAEGNRYPVMGGDGLDIDRRAGTGQARVHGGTPYPQPQQQPPAAGQQPYAPPAGPGQPYGAGPYRQPPAMQPQYAPAAGSADTMNQGWNQPSDRRVKRRMMPAEDNAPGSPRTAPGSGGGYTPPPIMPNPAEVFVPGVTPVWGE